MLFTGNQITGYFDEMFQEDARPRAAYADVARAIGRMPRATFAARSAEVGRHYANHGITFAHGGREETFPFDLVPRIVDRAEWDAVAAGLAQRVQGPAPLPGRHLRTPPVGRRWGRADTLVASCGGYLRAVAGIAPPGGRRVHLAGVDLVRDERGDWRVLEDTCGTRRGCRT